jgi:hypothetical protein
MGAIVAAASVARRVGLADVMVGFFSAPVAELLLLLWDCEDCEGTVAIKVLYVTMDTIYYMYLYVRRL